MAHAFLVQKLRLSAFGSYTIDTEKRVEANANPGDRSAIVPDVGYERCILGSGRFAEFVGPGFAYRNH